jgi:hypothetical protein
LTLSRERRSGGPNEASLTEEVEDLRQQIRRLRLYLGVSLSILGTGTLVALALVGLYGTRLAARVSEVDARAGKVDATTSTRAEEMRRELVAQGAEIVAIRKSATDDLQAMREAQRKLAGVRDPARELAALREANEALWNELANQKSELLGSLRDRPSEPGLAAPAPAPVPPLPPGPRFRLAETAYVEPGNEREPDKVRGFLPAGENIHRANNLPANPALLLIEVTPKEVGLGESYRLVVRLVNRSNRMLDPRSLRLDWSFKGMNTGGDVPVAARRIDAQTTALLYEVSGLWSESQEASPVSVTATVTLLSGERLSNTLAW